MGQAAQQMNVQDINTLLGIGGLQQQQAQTALTQNQAIKELGTQEAQQGAEQVEESARALGLVE